MNRNVVRSLVWVTAGCLVSLGTGGCCHTRPQEGGPRERQQAFPPAGMDLVNHELTIGLYKVTASGELGELLEDLKFTGRMLVDRGQPYVNNEGRRQIDFQVRNWEAFAYSDALDTVVVYRLADGEQRPSSIVAENKGRDFPATFTFNVRFDALAYGEVFVRGHHGRPEGHGFLEVPPSGDRRRSPTLRGFESVRIELDHPGLGRLRFVPKDCNDQNSKTLGSVVPKPQGR